MLHWTVDLHIQVLTARFQFVHMAGKQEEYPVTIEVSVSMEPVFAILGFGDSFVHIELKADEGELVQETYSH